MSVIKGELKKNSKIKSFVKRNRTAIIGGGIGLIGAGLVLFGYEKGLKRGLKLGAADGFYATISWFETTFPDKNWV